MEIIAEEDLLRNRNRQFVDAVETGGQKYRQPLLLMPPELFISDQGLCWSKEILDLRSAPSRGEPFRRSRQQVLEPDRILPDLTAGDMRREIERDGRPRVHGHQFVQVTSAEHRASSVRKGLPFEPRNPAYRSPAESRQTIGTAF